MASPTTARGRPARSRGGFTCSLRRSLPHHQEARFMKQFKTESKKLLDLMINSIYTN